MRGRVALGGLDRRALLAALSLVFKTIPRSLVVETVGRVWVLGGLQDGRV